MGKRARPLPTIKQRENPSGFSLLSIELLKPLLVALVSAVGGIIAYVATPLNEMVNAWIWKEQAEMLLVVQNPSLREGDAFALDIFLQPTSPAPISDGTLRISFTLGIFHPAPGTSLVLETSPFKVIITFCI